MRRRKEEIEEVEEIEEDEEVDEKELKKKKREEKKEKRLKRKKQDKASRWAGTVMLFVIMIVGFMLWVSGQLTQGPSEYVRPVSSPTSVFTQPSTTSDSPSGRFATPPSKVIVR